VLRVVRCAHETWKQRSRLAFVEDDSVPADLVEGRAPGLILELGSEGVVRGYDYVGV